MLRVKIPITKHEEVAITNETMVELLQTELVVNYYRGWDDIIEREDGTMYYVDYGYGSHRIGKRTGADITAKDAEKIKILNQAIKYFQDKGEVR